MGSGRPGIIGAMAVRVTASLPGTGVFGALQPQLGILCIPIILLLRRSLQ